MFQFFLTFEGYIILIMLLDFEYLSYSNVNISLMLINSFQNVFWSRISPADSLDKEYTQTL